MTIEKIGGPEFWTEDITWCQAVKINGKNADLMIRRVTDFVFNAQTYFVAIRKERKKYTIFHEAPEKIDSFDAAIRWFNEDIIDNHIDKEDR